MELDVTRDDAMRVYTILENASNELAAQIELYRARQFNELLRDAQANLRALIHVKAELERLSA